MKLKFLLAVFVVATATVSLPRFAIAQNELNLRVSPTITEISADVNERISVSINYTNTSAEDATVGFTFENFLPGTDGTPELGGAADNKYGLADFFEPAQPLGIGAGENADVRFAINIPGDAPAQTYYGIVRAEQVTQGEEALRTSIGTLVLLDVGTPGLSGEISGFSGSENVDLENNVISATFTVALKNTGEFTDRPVVTVQILDQNDIVMHELTQPTNGNVLPQSVREFTFDFKEDLDTNKSYRAQARAVLSDGTEIVSDELVTLYETENVQTEAEPVVEEEEDSLIPYIIAGASILLIIGVVLTLFFLSKRRNKTHDQTMQQQTFSPGAPNAAQAPDQTEAPPTNYPPQNPPN